MQTVEWPDISFWEELSQKSSECTFFHTPLWHRIIVKTFKNYSIATKGFIFEDGNRAVLPLIQTSQTGLLNRKRRLKSSVFNFYGGIIAERKLSEDHQNQIYSYLGSLNASILIVGNPFSEYSPPDFFKRTTDVAYVVPLYRGNEYIFSRLSRGARRGLDKAKRKGVVVRIMNTEEEFPTYLEIYRDTLKRWGTAALYTYPAEFFFNMIKDAGDAVKIWVAEKDGKVIAVLNMVYWNQIASGFHSVFLQDYFDCCPNHILHMEAMNEATKRGFHHYDLGPSAGLHGVEQFKKSFGAEPFPCFIGSWKYPGKK